MAGKRGHDADEQCLGSVTIENSIPRLMRLGVKVKF